MITMAMIGKVLRMHHRDNKSVREIARATSLSRNTVRKYLRRGKAEAPRYRRPLVPIKLSPYVEQLTQALQADARRPKKERRTGRALFEQSCAGAFDVERWQALRRELKKIRAEGYCVSLGELDESIVGFGAPLMPEGQVIEAAKGLLRELAGQQESG